MHTTLLFAILKHDYNLVNRNVLFRTFPLVLICNKFRLPIFHYQIIPLFYVLANYS